MEQFFSLRKVHAFEPLNLNHDATCPQQLNPMLPKEHLS